MILLVKVTNGVLDMNIHGGFIPGTLKLKTA